MNNSNDLEVFKCEIKKELLKEIEGEVAEEVNQAINQKRFSQKTIGMFKNSFFAIAATIMALGQFSEAVTLIEDGINWTRSKVTNTVEYNLLSHIKVGNSSSYMEELLGSPQITKNIEPGIIANYYHSEKFLLTILTSEDRAIAYTIIPLIDGFQPKVPISSDLELLLGDFTYLSYPGVSDSYLIDHSKVISYYLEAFDIGRTGLFLKVYLGNTVTHVNGMSQYVVELYNKKIFENQPDIDKAHDSLRTNLIPNFFGMGDVPLEYIQKSLLTAAEFSSYFGM